MEGIADQGVLTVPGALDEFDLATPRDRAEIRRLLRENPMGGAIRLSLEPAEGSELEAEPGELLRQVLVGRRVGGGLFGVGSRSVRMMYINGHSRPVGYLGSLRLDADYRGTRRPRTLLHGYERLRELHEADHACDFYLTSIMSDNLPARRILEAGLAGMPTYRFVGEFVSLVMRVRRRRWCGSSDGLQQHDPQAVLDLHDACRYQLGPVWDDAESIGPSSSDFRVALDDRGRVTACAALWDRRLRHRIVVRGYSPAVARWRGAINLAARITGHPRLPPIGQPLRLAYVSHAAAAPTSSPSDLAELVESLHHAAAARGLDYAVAGLPARDPRLAALKRRFGGRELRSRLYVVYWADGRLAAESIDERRPPCPEVALL
jgi:hypothetical protein